MLLKQEGAPGDSDVVTGREEGDQAEEDATKRLNEAVAVEG